MDFYTFVDITPEQFNDKQKDIHGIDYVYTDNTGKVIKKTISKSGNEKIPDGISIVHLVLERDKQVYESNEQGYMDILSDKCSTIKYRNQLIEILGGEPIEETDYMYNADSPLSSPKPSTTDLLSQTSEKQSPPSLSLDNLSTQSTPRTGMKPGWNTYRRPLSATSAQSRPPSGSSQQTLIKPGRRALVYNSGAYQIGIVGLINGSTKQYVIDVPSGTERSRSYLINSEDFEDSHHIPKKFVSKRYYNLLTNSTEKPRNNIFLLKEKSLFQLRTKEQSGRTLGGKKTKKVHPAKKNITRSKRR
jgi:hypothetical protein